MTTCPNAAPPSAYPLPPHQGLTASKAMDLATEPELIGGTMISALDWASGFHATNERLHKEGLL